MSEQQNQDPKATENQDDPGALENQDPKNQKSDDKETHDKGYLKALREKLRANEDKVKAFEKAKADAEEAEALKKGEYEKLLAEAKTARERIEAEKAELDARARQRVLKRELRAQAALAGMLDIDDVDLISTKDAEFDADGEPLNAEELIAAFKKKKPGKFKTESDEEDDDEEDDKAKRKGNVRKTVSTPLPARDPKKTKKSAFDMTDEEFETAWKKA